MVSDHFGLVSNSPSFPVLDNMHSEHLCMLFCGLPLLKTRLLVQEEEEVRPASPKYDERSFFYTTPAAFKPAALSGRPQTQWATEGTFLGPALHADHNLHPTVSSQAAELQHQQQQQQQQSEHVQNPSRKRNAAGIHDLLLDSCEHVHAYGPTAQVMTRISHMDIGEGKSTQKFLYMTYTNNMSTL